MTSRLRVTLTAGSALLIAVALGACASLPTNGGIRLKTLHGSGNQPQGGVQVLPVPPGADWNPGQIVRGFLAASASFADRHAAARQYLTASFAKRWKPGWAATIIGPPDVHKAPATQHLITAGGGSPAVQVTVTSKYLAVMKTTTTVRYEASNVVVSATPARYTFTLTQNGGAWRIADINQGNKLVNTLLLLTKSDFERDYLPRNLYYFAAGQGWPKSQIPLIPEPVYLPQQASSSQGVRGIVRSLLSPPPVSSWLYAAARTAFPKGTKLIGEPQVIGGITAVVDLGGAAAKASKAQLTRMAAQLYWSLTASPYTPATGNQIRLVVLKVKHRVVSTLPPPLDASWVPRGHPGRLYFQEMGPGGGAVARRATVKGSIPANTPGGLGNGPLTAMAVTPGPADQAVLAACRGNTVYLVPQWAGTHVVSQRLPSPCTSLSWDGSRNLWVTGSKGISVLPGSGRGSPAKPDVDPVGCLASGCSGTATSLQVAPDGVRVAMILQTGKSATSARIMMGAISKSGAAYFVGQGGKLVRVGSDIPDPIALTWLDPDHLLVLGRSGNRTQLYEVPLNGSSSTSVPSPQGVTSITASWPDPGVLPRIVLGIGGDEASPAKILVSNAGLLDRGWSVLAKGATTPVFPG